MQDVDACINSHLYHNTLTALGFKKVWKGIELDNIDDEVRFRFGLTLSQAASKFFLELTGAQVTLKFSFGTALAYPVELYLIAEKFSQVFINSAQEISKNQLLTSARPIG